MIAPARVAAYDILTAVSAGRTDLATAVANSRPRLRDNRDRSLAAEISFGVQRWRASLDHLIEHFSHRRVTKLDSEIVEILRLGAYQLTHLTRVPAAAAVDDAVDLARRAGKPSACGLVNAVLRAISRSRHALPLPARPPHPDQDREHAIHYLSVSLSHPRWLVERWYERLGFDRAERWLTFNNAPAPLTLRANPLRTTSHRLLADLARNGVSLKQGQYAPHSLIIDEGHSLADLGPSDGRFVVQDEASQLVSLLAGSDPGPRVLDTCASPGGKATAIAASLPDNGLLVACDVRSRRMALLRRTVKAAGADKVRLVQTDLARGLPFNDRFSCVLVDVPCTGLGILRRDPDIRWRRQPADIVILAGMQHRMLLNAAETVAPGGRLIYSTCSSEPEENEQVAEAFLQHASGFKRIDARFAHPGLPAVVVDARGHLRTTPDEHGLESFFGAVFERLVPGA